MFLQIIAGAIPLLFMLSSSAAVGQVQAAAHGGAGSAAWTEMQLDLILSGAALAASQIVIPVQQVLGRAIQLRIDAYLHDRLMTAVFATPSIAVIERPDVRANLDEAVIGLRTGRRSAGAAAAASITLLARYVGFTGALVLGRSHYRVLALRNWTRPG